jgi:threonine/homoserine/homoserine lactone efflux protein
VLSVVVICTPGPDSALTVRNSLSGGRRAGVYTGLGVAAGQLVWTLAAGVGVSLSERRSGNTGAT